MLAAGTVPAALPLPLLPSQAQAYGAIASYGCHLVVANELHSRKDRVWLVAQQARGGGGGQGEGKGAGGAVHSARIQSERPRRCTVEPCLNSAADLTGPHRASLPAVQGGKEHVRQIDRPPEVPIIEELLVAEIVTAHRQHMAAAAAAEPAAAAAAAGS